MRKSHVDDYRIFTCEENAFIDLAHGPRPARAYLRFKASKAATFALRKSIETLTEPTLRLPPDSSLHRRLGTLFQVKTWTFITYYGLIAQTQVTTFRVDASLSTTCNNLTPFSILIRITSLEWGSPKGSGGLHKSIRR